jgi:hypothetical protein
MKRISMFAVLTAVVWATLGGGVAFGESPLEERVKKLEGKVAALEATLQGVTRVESGVAGKPTIQFSGVNVQVVNGSGSESTLNGEGNLMIGYNQSSSSTGSHNLALGESPGFFSYGGIVGGAGNTLASTARDSIAFGLDNAASGPQTAVIAGLFNEAHSAGSSISGGQSNTTIRGSYNSISGGAGNTAEGLVSVVSGGANNKATGYDASVSGGTYNTATEAAAISGGFENTANGYWSSISGGKKNKTPGAREASWIGGGYENIAESEFSAIYGGEKESCLGFERPIPPCHKP